MATPKQTAAWWQPVWELVVHVLVGSFLFAIIFAPAILLDLAVTWLKGNANITEFLLGLLTWTKYGIAIIDVAVYFVFMVNMAWRFTTELRWEKKHD